MIVLIAAASLLASGFAAAQTAAASAGQAPSQFDVASIKPCAPDSAPEAGTRARAGAASPGYLYLDCMTLRQLLNIASGNSDNTLNAHFRNRREGGFDAVRGGPSWVASDRFTVEARAAGVTNRKMLTGAPLLALLEDRFQLKFHRATEDRPVYALTIAPAGLKLTPVAPDTCYDFDPANMPAPGSMSGRTPCGLLTSQAPFRAVGAKLGKAPLAGGTALSDFLSNIMDRVVVDRTGLDAWYDIAFDYTPNEATPGVIERFQRGRDGGPPQPLPTEGPAIFTALANLGLILTPSKVPVEYLVIDRVEKLRPDLFPAVATRVGAAR